VIVGKEYDASKQVEQVPWAHSSQLHSPQSPTQHGSGLDGSQHSGIVHGKNPFGYRHGIWYGPLTPTSVHDAMCGPIFGPSWAANVNSIDGVFPPQLHDPQGGYVKPGSIARRR